MNKKYVLLLSTLLLSFNVKAQQGVMDSLRVYPPHPTAQDSIRIIYYVSFTSGGCDLQSQATAITQGNIFVNSTYCPGMLTYICTHWDTISIPPQPAGIYQVHVNILSGYYDMDSGKCINYMPVDTGNTTFEVFSSNLIKESNQKSIRLSQNGKSFSLYSPTSIRQLVLYDLNGRKAKQIDFINAKSIQVNASDLTNGIYVGEIRTALTSEVVKIVLIE